MPAVLMLLDFTNQTRTFETFLVRLTHALHEQDWKAVYVFSGEPSESFAAELSAADAEYRVANFPLDKRECNRLIDSLVGCSFDAMTTSFISTFDRFNVRLKKRLKIRRWLVHDHSSGRTSEKSALQRFLAKRRGWYFGRQVDRVMCVSQFIAERDVKEAFLPKSKITVLNNGVDLDRFCPAMAEAESARLAFIGQLIPEKGVHTLLRAMKILKQRGRTVELHIAGKGAAENELRAFTAENDLSNVIFLGQVSDVPSLYRSATIVVVPSEWAEAAALVNIEAMACGACVLASDAGGNPDLIGREQEAGKLFRAGDASDLADKLIVLLDDAAAVARLRQNARARAERLFSLNGMVDGFIRQLNGELNAVIGR